MYVCMYLCMKSHCINVFHRYVCIYVCMYVCVYVCMYEITLYQCIPYVCMYVCVKSHCIQSMLEEKYVCMYASCMCSILYHKHVLFMHGTAQYELIIYVCMYVC
jgi:hypothetical protein